MGSGLICMALNAFPPPVDGQQVAVFVVGDAVLEPFWPEGLGINRGFHTVLDAVSGEEWE